MSIFPYRLLITAMGLVIFAGILTRCMFNPPTIRMKEVSQEDNSWVPDGYEKYNSSFAMRWGEVRLCNPELGYTCVEVEIFSRSNCPSLYVEATELTKNGVNIGYTNATTAGLKAGEFARVDLTSRQNAERYRLSDIKCY